MRLRMNTWTVNSIDKDDGNKNHLYILIQARVKHVQSNECDEHKRTRARVVCVNDICLNSFLRFQVNVIFACGKSDWPVDSSKPHWKIQLLKIGNINNSLRFISVSLRFSSLTVFRVLLVRHFNNWATKFCHTTRVFFFNLTDSINIWF